MSQKAHLIIESAVITASLHAQLNASNPDPPALLPLLLLALDDEDNAEAAVLARAANGFELEFDRTGFVSVLSHNFCNAAKG